MHLPAEQYLAVRALGAPAAVVSLAVQGVFRGSKDTKTPLYAIAMRLSINPVGIRVLCVNSYVLEAGSQILTAKWTLCIARLLWSRQSEQLFNAFRLEIQNPPPSNRYQKSLYGLSKTIRTS
eukprot:Gb_07979 [translate_table: standard]